MAGAPSQDFSPRTLKWMRKWKSQGHLVTNGGTYPASDLDWKALLTSISASIHADKFSFAGLHTAIFKKKVILSTRRLEESLVLRKINDNVRRCYGIRQPNRQSLIRTAKQAIKENTPKTIIRIDIKKCFESICRKSIFEKLYSDGLVSHQTSTLLEQLFISASRLKPRIDSRGLPRGVIVSTSLAEIRLSELDLDIRSIPGVYLVLRYVDDILVFSTEKEESAKSSIDEVLKNHKLAPNPIKSNVLRIACVCENSCVHGNACPCKKYCNCFEMQKQAVTNFEYLGYKLFLSKHNANKDDNYVYALISDRKMKRIKTRIHLAVASYCSTLDHGLLEKRIRYLTANQAINHSANRRALLNGLAFTHSEYEAPSSSLIGRGNLLKDLDTFYRTRLRKGTKNALPVNFPALMKLSFASGYEHKRRTKFSALEMVKIRRCWESA